MLISVLLSVLLSVTLVIYRSAWKVNSQKCSSASGTRR